MQATDILQVIADVTNATSGRFSETPPRWARNVRIQMCFADDDLLLDVHIDDREYARDCGPHVVGADNLALPNWDAPHISAPVTTNSEIDVNINVVTAGEGKLVILFEG